MQFPNGQKIDLNATKALSLANLRDALWRNASEFQAALQCDKKLTFSLTADEVSVLKQLYPDQNATNEVFSAFLEEALIGLEDMEQFAVTSCSFSIYVGSLTLLKVGVAKRQGSLPY